MASMTIQYGRQLQSNSGYRGSEEGYPIFFQMFCHDVNNIWCEFKKIGTQNAYMCMMSVTLGYLLNRV